MLSFYRFITPLLAPLLKLHLRRRLKRGKEDPTRLYERFGGASLPRPSGKLLWIHAASVGESVSVLPLIFRLNQRYPEVNLMLTTGTVTSAELMAQRLPRSVIHQFVPLDVPKWVKRFLEHWQPNGGVIIESELWPNMLYQARHQEISLILLNASLSEKSYCRWQGAKSVIQELLSYFSCIMTPSLETAVRLKNLGATHVDLSINLKFLADPLPVNRDELGALNSSLKRPLYTAVSTHPGEEEVVIEAYLKLKPSYPTLLLILAPRHPHRASSLVEMMRAKGLSIAQRSLGELPTQAHDVWLIDTIGELGLIYSLAPFCFLGGSLVPIGGHNAIEPFLLGCTVIQGEQTFKSNHINQLLRPVLATVQNAEDLSGIVKLYLDQPDHVMELQRQATVILQDQRQGLEEIVDKIVEELR